MVNESESSVEASLPKTSVTRCSLEPKGKESGCGSLLHATSNEQSILGVETIPKTSLQYPLY